MSTAGQLERQPTVDRPDHQSLAGIADGRDMVEHPADLARREIGIDDQSGRRGHRRLMPARNQLGAGVGGAPVLPYDRRGEWLAGRTVPSYDCFALVGDADRGNIPGAAGSRHHLASAGQRRRPDRAGILFYPAGSGMARFDRPLRTAMDAPVDAEQQRPGRSRPFVENEDQRSSGHRLTLGATHPDRKSRIENDAAVEPATPVPLSRASNRTVVLGAKLARTSASLQLVRQSDTVKEVRLMARSRPLRRTGDRLKRLFYKNASYEVIAVKQFRQVQ